MLAAFDSWIFVLLVAMAAMLRWLASKATAPKDQDGSQDRPTTQPDRPTGETPVSDEEQIRKFLEALGQPRTAKPPPPIPPRTDLAPRPVAPVRPPRSMVPVPQMRTSKSPIERRQETESERRAETIPPPLPKRIYEPQPAVRPAETTVFEVRETSPPLPELTSVPKFAAQTAAQTPATNQQKDRSILDLLRSGRGLREAVILREILGPPRGMQPFEFSGIA